MKVFIRLRLTLIALTFTLATFFASSTFGQTVAAPTNDEILDRTQKQAEAYVEAFKNLIANETKTFEIFGKDGEEKKRRGVVSTFLVYPLTKTTDQVVEFRNVLSVDGKSVKDADKRTQDFFEKVAKAESSENEMKKLREESTRNDLEISISGLTLFQAIVLNTRLRPFFEFSERRPAKLNGRDVFIIDYTQVKDSPEIAVNINEKNLVKRPVVDYEFDADKKVELNARLRGSLTIDAETFQLWSELRELTIQPADFPARTAVIEDRFEFQTSEFGILTPKLISHTQYQAKIKENRVSKIAAIKFEYGNFSRPGVDVKSSDVKQ